MFANYLIGLREGLEASLVVSILVAYLVKTGRRDRIAPVAVGVATAVVLSAAFGALLTYTSADVLQSFESREIFGGTLSIVAVVFVTWMIFWMRRAARGMRAELSGSLDAALALGAFAVAMTAFIAVAREGLETTLFFWSAVQAAGSTFSPVLGFTLGIATSIVIAWLLYRRSVTLNLARFFTWTGAGLVVVAAGVLAYGVHDLQEGGVLGGLNTLAFDVSAQVPPSSWYGTLLKGTSTSRPRPPSCRRSSGSPTSCRSCTSSCVGQRVAPDRPRPRGAARELDAAGGSAPRPRGRARRRRRARGVRSGEKPAKSGAVGVTASDSACKSTSGDVASGNRTFSVKNDGSQITEVYVYGTGDRVMGEVENIGPATSRDLVVQLPPGKYQIACKPGMIGDGIRTALAVVRQGRRATRERAAPDRRRDYRRYVQSETKTLVDLTIPFAAAVKANDIPKAKRLYATARVHYERIEPIAESFPELDTAIDIRADGVTKGEPWTGFHRLERDLWQRGDITERRPARRPARGDARSCRRRSPR